MITETNRLLVKGIVISKIACNHERQVYAHRNNLDIDNVPLKYGSLRLAVNVLSVNGRTYRINKNSLSPNIKEERLILELSYRYKEGIIIPEHNIINLLEQGKVATIVMNKTYISSKHNIKLVTTSTNDLIKTYFVKGWADDAYVLANEFIKVSKNRRIYPKNFVRGIDTANILQLTK